MKLVENARTAWRWFSIQIAALGVAIQAAAAALPSVDKYLGETVLHIIGGLILLSIIGGRLVSQDKSDKACPPDPPPPHV
jgi:hypothetical protein